MNKTDIIIIGSGPGGYRAAAYAASKGKTVTIFEGGSLGGTCLNVGCIPTKTLARSAEAVGEMKHAAALGVKAVEAEFSLADIVARKDSVVAQLREGIATLLAAPGITLVRAKAKFTDDHTVEADGEQYTAGHIIIATGSTHKSLRLEELDERLLLTSDALLSLTEKPRRLCIVGAGVIGMEFASIFCQLGVEVTVVEFLKECIPALDADIAKRLRKQLEKCGVTFYMQSAVRRIAGGRVTFERKGKELSVEADKVLVAVGRRPLTEGLGLENTHIGQHERGGIVVDDNMQTSVPGVYAIGDVNVRMMLAHAATMQGLHAVNHILGVPDNIQLDIMPAAIFTHPEAACVGKTEDQLKAEGVAVEVHKAHYRANGRALAMGEEGMLKLVCEPDGGRILSLHAYGAHSADMVQEVSCLMCKQTTLRELREMVHIHPTLGEMLNSF